MKNLFLLMAALTTSALTFTACEDDTDPIAHRPTDNHFLNTPPTADQSYDLANSDDITLTCSQPDYGVITTPTYAVQLSLDHNFEGTPDAWKYTGAGATPLDFIELPNVTTNTDIVIHPRDIADAINACRGYNDLAQLEEAGYTNYNGAVYLRIRSFFAGANADVAELYTVLSNVITLSQVKGYATLRQPGYIYLVGSPSGWQEPSISNAIHYNNWKLFEPSDKIGSNTYSATFDIPANQFNFRFYTALTGWDENSYGSQVSDNAINITLNANGVYSGSSVSGKGSWQIPEWQGGKVNITVNRNANTVEFKKL